MLHQPEPGCTPDLLPAGARRVCGHAFARRPAVAAEFPTGSARLRGGPRSGYTLTELLIIMTVLSILLMTALPPMFATVRRTRLELARQSFIGDLRLARIEAIRRNVSIAVSRVSATTYTIDSIGTRTLEHGAMFSSGPPTLRFAAFGPVPTGAAQYTLLLDGRTATVRVSTSGNPTAE